jgi:hypothetical protein
VIAKRPLVSVVYDSESVGESLQTCYTIPAAMRRLLATYMARSFCIDPQRGRASAMRRMQPRKKDICE